MNPAGRVRWQHSNPSTAGMLVVQWGRGARAVARRAAMTDDQFRDS
jgi:hypothetical protein